MFANRYTALIDACSLVSVWRRNLLLSLAEAEFFRVRWSQTILDETERALVKMHKAMDHDDSEDRSHRSITAMQRAFPEAMVENYDALLVCSFGLPDANDEHVLAAALQTQAQTIVTENLKDFPRKVLDPRGIEARNADEFIADTIALDEGRGVAAVRQMRERLKQPEIGPEELLRALEANGLVETASVLGSHVSSI